MDTPLITSLNDAQKEAVLATDGPILILAGAGSGKTKVLTHKVAYLIREKHVPSGNILMVTFTNKAANEMKNRIANLLKIHNPTTENPFTRQSLGDGGQHTTNLPFAGTYHALCARILRKHGGSLGITPNFIIYDGADTKEVIREAVEQLDLDRKKFHAALVAAIISQAKNELISATEYPQSARGFIQEGVSRIYLTYQKILHKNNALDFDDLLFAVVKLLRDYPDVASYYQDMFCYVLVDEYQDTNRAQYVLTTFLAKRYRN